MSARKFSIIATMDKDKPEEKYHYCNIHEYTRLVKISENLYQCQICGFMKETTTS